MNQTVKGGFGGYSRGILSLTKKETNSSEGSTTEGGFPVMITRLCQEVVRLQFESEVNQTTTGRLSQVEVVVQAAVLSILIQAVLEEGRMAETAAIVNHSGARARALNQAARRASVKVMADTEIGAGLGKAPLANTVVDAIQEEVEVAASEIAI